MLRIKSIFLILVISWVSLCESQPILKKFMFESSRTTYIYKKSGSVDLVCEDKVDENRTWYRPPQFNISISNELRIINVTNLDYGTYYCVTGSTSEEVLTVKKVILLPMIPEEREGFIDEEVQYIENVRPQGNIIHYLPAELKNVSDFVTWERPAGTILLDQGREFRLNFTDANTDVFYYYRINRKGDHLINKVGKIFISKWKYKEVQVLIEGAYSYGAELKLKCFPPVYFTDYKVYWKKNNESYHEGYAYNIKKYQEESFRNYTCEIKKEGEILTSILYLTPVKDVTSKIEMKTEEGTFHYFQVGETKELYCNILRREGYIHYSEKDIIWTFQGRIVEDTDSSDRVNKGFKLGNSTSRSNLTLTNMDDDNEGTYKCFQGLSTLTVYLLMERKNILLKVSPKIETVIDNAIHSVEFTCEANVFISSAKYKWYFKDISSDNLKSFPKEVVISSPSPFSSLLTIDNVLTRHEGIYACEVFNKRTFGIIVVKSNFDPTSNSSNGTLDSFPKVNFICQYANLDANISSNKINESRRSSSLEMNGTTPYKDGIMFKCDVNEAFRQLYREIKYLKTQHIKKNIKMKKLENQSKKNKDSFELQLNTAKNEMDIMRKDMENYRKDMENYRKDMENYRKEISSNLSTIENNYNNVLNDLMILKEIKKIENCKAIDNIKEWIKMNKNCPNIKVDFIWKIDQVKKKVNRTLISEQFYVNDYLFKLYFKYTNTNYSFGFYILKGENNTESLWPSIINVTISLINQESFKSIESETFNYKITVIIPFLGPSVNLVRSRYYDLSKFPLMLHNDTLVITCQLSK